MLTTFIILLCCAAAWFIYQMGYECGCKDESKRQAEKYSLTK